jgi:hypothetical protein
LKINYHRGRFQAVKQTIEILPCFPSPNDLVIPNTSVEEAYRLPSALNARASTPITCTVRIQMMTYIMNESHFLRQANKFEEGKQ